MTDVATQEPENEFAQELADAFAANEADAGVTPEKPAEEPKPGETPPASDKPKEEPKKDDPEKPEDPKKSDEATPPAKDEKKPKDGTEEAKDPKAPATPEEPVAPQPLTKDDVTSVIRNLRDEERTSSQNLETATKEVMDAYYPEGLSNVLVDQKSGKELRSPADVVEASGGEMSTEEAAQWLMNEQYKLDQNIAKIQDDAKTIAEATVKFKQDSADVIQRYEPLFKAYPQVQQKVWDQYKKLIKVDEAKGVILSAPDMREFYDTVLDPYRLAYEYSQKQSATNPVDDPKKPEEPAKPGAEDRLDESGDSSGASDVNDPNDFAQQVKKELAKEL